MFRRFANFQNDETDPSTGQVRALSLFKLDKNDFIEAGGRWNQRTMEQWLRQILCDWVLNSHMSEIVLAG